MQTCTLPPPSMCRYLRLHSELPLILSGRPADMYIADLTEVLCKKKRLQMPVTDWVLCLADLTLALPLDRTVASLGFQTDLALVRRQWAMEHGLRIDDRRGGDPSGKSKKSIIKIS